MPERLFFLVFGRERPDRPVLAGFGDLKNLVRMIRRCDRSIARLTCFAAMLLCLLRLDPAAADEAGVSFWLPGQYGSFAATPTNPGWSIEDTYYHASADASRGISFSRGGGIQAGMTSPSDYFMFTPTYAFATPIFGAQAALGATLLYGRNTTSVSAALTGSGGTVLTGFNSDQIYGFGDLTPTASLKWTSDVHNFMVYTTANVPVGAYQANRLASLGIGHWAADGGVGYTYLDEAAGIEASVVFGLTYNFINPYTQYQSGTDAHLDWAISPYLNDKFHVGAVGYFYNQVTGDSGPGARLGDFKSRVAGIGPQIGFFMPFFGREGYLNFRVYYEFDASNRLEGWNGFVAFSIEPPEQKVPSAATLR